MYTYMGYLPAYLQDIRELNAIGNCSAELLEQLQIDCQQAYANYFIMSASEKVIRRWERILSISVQVTQSLPERRKKILSKMNSVPPITVKKLKELASDITGIDCRIDIDYDIYKFDVILLQDSLIPPPVDLLAWQIDDIKPANMLYTIVVEAPMYGLIHSAIGMLDGEILTIRQVV